MEVLTAGVEIAAGLRDGPAAPAAAGAVRRLRALLELDAVGLLDLDGARSWAGPTDVAPVDVLVAEVLRTHRRDDVQALPLRVRGEPAGVLIVVGSLPASVARQAAAWVADALHRGRLEASADAAEQAELRALRAEISPHFVYNALTSIASFVRSDPGRARELILDFALFIRHNLARRGEYTTLAGEFRAVEAYLALARAVLGERLHVQVRIAPRCCPSRSRSWPCSRWWRTPCSTGSSAPRRAGRCRSAGRPTARTASSPWRTTGRAWRPSAPRTCWPGGGTGRAWGWPTWTAGCAPCSAQVTAW
jgi:two-component system, LytTR family, sensor kinase